MLEKDNPRGGGGRDKVVEHTQDSHDGPGVQLSREISSKSNLSVLSQTTIFPLNLTK